MANFTLGGRRKINRRKVKLKEYALEDFTNNFYSFKILFKQPKLDKYNKNDVITNPNEVKEIIKYLEKQGDSEILVTICLNYIKDFKQNEDHQAAHTPCWWKV